MITGPPEPLTELRKLLKQTRRMSGRAFLERITIGLSEFLDGAYVQVGRLSRDGRSIFADPCAQNGCALTPIHYDIENTPCAHVVGSRTRYFDRGVVDTFPDDTFLRVHGFVSYLGCPMFTSKGEPSGLLSVLSTKALAFTEADVAVFEALALRVGADMERVQAIEAREASEALFREIVDLQTEMVCRFSSNGNVTFANRAYLKTFGIDPRTLGDFSFEARMHPDDREKVRQELAKISRDNPRAVIENRIFSADGKMLWTQWTNIGLYDSRGQFIGYQSAGRDITAAKQAEDRLREAHEQKDKFLAILAHELRNPLGAILNAISVLEYKAQNGLTDPRALAIGKRQAQQQARLLDDLLDMSRITRGKLQLHKTRISLFRAVADVAEARRAVFESKAQLLRLFLPNKEIFVCADRVRLEQIIANLLDNASKYTPKNGCVKIEGEIFDEMAAVRVIDSGKGISEEMLTRIFEMFQQDPEAGTVTSGLGIGLTVVRELVNRHGGTVFAASPGPGAGSTFTVCLPTVSVQPTEGAADISVVSSEVRRRILVVDDNVDAADMLADLLRAWGHEVIAVYDGETAIRVARTQKPELAFIDIAMPGLDGHATACRIRSEHQKTDMTLVALTGFGQPSDVRKSYDACFDQHLTKPADHTILHQVLRDRSYAS